MKMLTPAARVRLLPFQGDYEIDKIIYAPLLHKKIMALATIDSIAMTKTLCSNLRELPTYCSTIKGDIELLHSYFNANYTQIIARWATVGGSIMEHTTQESVERIIFSEVHKKRYTLAGEAPIFNRELFQDFGYRANTPASRVVLDGTYVAPLTSGKATRDLSAEIAAIRCLIPANSVPIIITPEQW
jgi:hypothetical protein